MGSKKVVDSHRAESELQSERVFRNQRDRDDWTGYMVNEKQAEYGGWSSGGMQKRKNTAFQHRGTAHFCFDPEPLSQ